MPRASANPIRTSQIFKSYQCYGLLRFLYRFILRMKTHPSNTSLLYCSLSSINKLIWLHYIIPKVSVNGTPNPVHVPFYTDFYRNVSFQLASVCTVFKKLHKTAYFKICMLNLWHNSMNNEQNEKVFQVSLHLLCLVLHQKNFNLFYFKILIYSNIKNC